MTTPTRLVFHESGDRSARMRVRTASSVVGEAGSPGPRASSVPLNSRFRVGDRRLRSPRDRSVSLVGFSGLRVRDREAVRLVRVVRRVGRDLGRGAGGLPFHHQLPGGVQILLVEGQPCDRIGDLLGLELAGTGTTYPEPTTSRRRSRTVSSRPKRNPLVGPVDLGACGEAAAHVIEEVFERGAILPDVVPR